MWESFVKYPLPPNKASAHLKGECLIPAVVNRLKLTCRQKERKHANASVTEPAVMWHSERGDLAKATTTSQDATCGEQVSCVGLWHRQISMSRGILLRIR